MNALALLVAAASLGIDHGWQRLPDGGVEYVIQIEPDALDLLLNTDDVSSEIPAHLAGPEFGVRRVRITVGDRPLPKDPSPSTLAAKAAGSRPEGTAPNVAEDKLPADQGKVQPAKHQEPVATRRDANKQPASGPESTLSAFGTNPWIPLLAALGALALSIGANLYLGWIAWGARSRYRGLLRAMSQAPAAA